MFHLWLIACVLLAASGIAFGQDSYRCVDDGLKLDVIHSDPEAFYISMDMDPRGNLYVGGRDAVYLFETDGDGGFRTRKTIATLPEHTWAYSLQVAGDDLYVLTVTALYRMPGVIRDPGKATFERLVWGIPLGHIHQGFHGMKMGPDGALYLAFGDPHPGPFRRKTNPGHVWHWTFLSGPDSRKMPWTGVGGVVRYDPRSHELTKFSQGLRNICDLDFDEYWNLFGNDNDQEGSALHTFGRLTHLTEGSHYQWSRGWLHAKEPYRNDLITTIDPALGRFVPFGTCYYNEEHLGDAYGRSLFVARWGSRELGQFPLRTSGASFRSSQKTLLSGKGTSRPVAVFTGNDGRLFASICFMERNEKSPVKQTDLVVISNPKKPLIPHVVDPSAAGVKALLDEIESSSWKRRFNAHREIVSRGMSGDDLIRERFLEADAGGVAWHSLAWLAGRDSDERVVTALSDALSSPDGRAVSTAADVLRRFHRLSDSQVLSLLAHESPIAQLAGLRAVDRIPVAELVKSFGGVKDEQPKALTASATDASEPKSQTGNLRRLVTKLASTDDSLVRQAAQRWIGRHTDWLELEKQFNAGTLPSRRVALAAAMWKWNDTVESGIIPADVKLSKAATQHLNGFSYVDDSESNLKTEAAKHGFQVGGLPLMDWWKQTSSANPDALEFAVLKRMITQAIYDTDDAQRKTAAVFANTLGMDDLAARIPGLAQTRTIKADIAEGATLSANKAMPPEYQTIDWTTEWRKGDATTGAAIFKKRCIACHDSGFGGGVIGPSLAGVAKRFTPQYLAQSVAAPSKDISPNFQAWSIIQDDGKVLLGFLSGEDENRVILQMMDGGLKAVEKSRIEEKAPSKTSLMPIGLIKGPDDLKHIVRYLVTLKTSGAAAAETFIDLLADGDLKQHFETTGNWSLNEDGVVHLQPREGETDWMRYGDYLWLKNEYQDFQCEFEYRHEKGGNSGLYFNVADRQQAVGTVIEVQIRDSADEKELDAHAVTGGILPKVAPRANATKPAGEWNHMSVTSVSGDITVRLNGVLVNSVNLSHPRLATKPKQGFIGFQDHGLPFWLRNIRIRSLEPSPSLATSRPTVEEPREDLDAVTVHRAIDPLRANSFSFISTEAKYVRVEVLKSSSGQPCIDELEVFSSDSPENLALDSRGAKATASSLLKGFEQKHQIEFLNDGQYGNGRSWIPEKPTGWAQIELPEAAAIDRVVLSRDRGGNLTRRVPIAFDILLSSDGKSWKTAKKVRPLNALVPGRKRDTTEQTKATEPAPATSHSSATPARPNIVLILADDFGWGDASCNSPDSPIRTPHIDRIANEGIRLTNAHTPSAVCTPTRYGLLTGRYPWRSYLKKEVLPYYAPALITKGRTTLPSYLKSQGYRTGGFGKWHLGLDWTPVEGDPQDWRSHWNNRDRKVGARVGTGIDHTKPFDNAPTDIGFDKYFGTPSNAGRLPFFIEDNRVVGEPKRDKQGWMRDPNLARDKVDDIYVDKAIAFIESHEKQHADHPFFVYLPLNAIHGAVKVPQRFEGKTGMTQREDKILWADQNVGRVLTALDHMKLAEDTLLIFTTDNGPLNSPIARKNGHEPTGPYRGFKTCAWDGGTRVPFVARWPGHIPVGTTSDHLVGLTDMLATFAALCGEPLPEGAGPDSVNQLPVLLHQTDTITPRPALVTATYRGLLALRQDNWKAIFGTKWSGGHTNASYGGLGPDKTMDDPESGQLYNLVQDPYETKDLWESRPEIVTQLRREMDRIKRLDKSDPQPESPESLSR